MPIALTRLFVIRNLLAALLCWTAAGEAFSQQAAALNHQSWSTESGLPQFSVHQILQSHDGYLWLATEGGVVRYDGLSFKTFNHDTDPSFTSNDVTSLGEDGAGTLWFGTADGLIQSTNGRLRRYSEADGLPSSAIVALAAGRGGTFFVLTSGGLSRYVDGRFKALPSEPASITGLRSMPDGAVVAITRSAALALFGDRSFPARERVAVPLQGLALSPGGNLWSWSDHEVTVNLADRQLLWRTGADLPGTRVQTVFVDREGVAWIGTNRGLVTATAAAQRPAPVASLGVNSILSIFEDVEGNHWIGTETSGLHALRIRKFAQQPLLADEEVSAIVQSSDTSIWAGTREDGLRHLAADPTHSSTGATSHVANLTSPVILSLAPGPNGDVWAGTPDGLNHLASNGSVTRYTSSDGLPDDLIRSLLAANDGTLWIGTRRGLASFREGRFKVLTRHEGLGGDLIGVIYESIPHTGPRDASLWVGTLAGLSSIRNGVIRNYARSDGLSSNLVTSLATDTAGRLWVATRNAGLFLFRESRFYPVMVSPLPSGINSLIADRQGFLWLRDRHGVTRALADDLARCASDRSCNLKAGRYGAEDGMPSAELVANGEPSVWRTTGDELLFATREGVAVVNASNFKTNANSPPVVIQRVLLDNDEVPLTGAANVFPSGHTRYTFDYAGLSFTVPAKVLYRSRLEGFDSDWTSPGNRRTTTYTNLPAGRYSFRVQAANEDGAWNEAGARFSFRILPPLYRRWWFLLLVALSLGALAIAIYRLRLRRLQRAFHAVLAERNRIAREIHDTLAQDLVGTSLQLDLISQMLTRNNVIDAATQVKATRAFVKSGLEQARQSIWNLRADTAHDALPSKMNALVERFTTNGLESSLRIGGAYRPLPPALENEILRIVQEALSNVQRHARASHLRIDLSYGQDKLVLVVQDDGVGFQPQETAARSGHFGIQGMQERAALLHAELEISSTPAAGTTVTLSVPITQKKGAKR